MDKEEYEIIEGSRSKKVRDNLPDLKVNNHKLKRLNYKHLAIMDFILYSPNKTMTEIAKEMRATVSWVSLVVGSDLFQEELRRKRESLDTFKRDQLASRLLDSGVKALDRMDKVLDDEESSDSVAVTAAKNVMAGLGFLSTNAPAPGVNINVNGDGNQVNALGVTKEMLEKVKDRRN